MILKIRGKVKGMNSSTTLVRPWAHGFSARLDNILGGSDRQGIDGVGRCYRYSSNVLAVCCVLLGLSRLFRPHRTPPDGCGWLAPRGLGVSGSGRGNSKA